MDTCTECGTTLYGMYSNAMTCSDACRARRSRRMQKISKSYADLCRKTAAQNVAEMEIEARRDAIEAGYNIRANPHPAGTFECLIYIDECQRNWKTKLEIENVTDCKANG